MEHALANGTVHKKWDERLKMEVFDYYEPNDPDEYVIIIWDHAGLTHTETEKETKKALNLKESIDKLSSYFIDFRDNLHYTPVLIQQQNMDTISLEAFKQKKIMPTLAGLADTKNTGKDCSVFLGITNPHAFELPQYLGYDIGQLKDTFRVLEIVLARKGRANGLCPMFFNGAVNQFSELPLPTSHEINRVYQYVHSLHQQ